MTDYVPFRDVEQIGEDGEPAVRVPVHLLKSWLRAAGRTQDWFDAIIWPRERVWVTQQDLAKLGRDPSNPLRAAPEPQTVRVEFAPLQFDPSSVQDIRIVDSPPKTRTVIRDRAGRIEQVIDA